MIHYCAQNLTCTLISNVWGVSFLIKIDHCNADHFSISDYDFSFSIKVSDLSFVFALVEVLRGYI